MFTLSLFASEDYLTDFLFIVCKQFILSLTTVVAHIRDRPGILQKL